MYRKNGSRKSLQKSSKLPPTLWFRGLILEPFAMLFPALERFFSNLVFGTCPGAPLERFWPPMWHPWSHVLHFVVDFGGNFAFYNCLYLPPLVLSRASSMMASLIFSTFITTSYSHLLYCLGPSPSDGLLDSLYFYNRLCFRPPVLYRGSSLRWPPWFIFTFITASTSALLYCLGSPPPVLLPEMSRTSEGRSHNS